MFFIFSLIVILEDRSRRVVNTVLLAAGLSLSLLHVRALAIWGLFLMVPLGVAIAPSLHKATAVLESKRQRALVGALIGMCGLWNAATTYYAQGAQWGMGYSASPQDEKLLQVIREHMPNGGNIFNWHPLGAYLRWHLGPEFFVAMDGHFVNNRTSAGKAYDEIEDWSPSRPPLMEKWNIRVVYHPVVMPIFGSLSWLPYYLVHDPKWRMVAMDGAGVLFARTPTDDVDEQTRNHQKIDYWKKVLTEATDVELSFASDENKKRAKRISERAQASIEELRKLSDTE